MCINYSHRLPNLTGSIMYNYIHKAYVQLYETPRILKEVPPETTTPGGGQISGGMASLGIIGA